MAVVLTERWKHKSESKIVMGLKFRANSKQLSETECDVIIGHLHKEAMWPILPLNNEFESCLMSKIDRAHKNYLTPEIWEEMHLREIFYGTLIFQQSSMICIGRHVGGHTLALQHSGQNYFCLYLVKHLIVTLRCAVNITTWSFQHFPWSLSVKFLFRNR